jgi:hypothetical protein
MAQPQKSDKTYSILSLKLSSDATIGGKIVKAGCGSHLSFSCCDPIGGAKYDTTIINSFWYNESKYTEEFVKDWVNAINEDFCLDVTYEGTSFFGENCFSENNRRGYYELSFPVKSTGSRRYIVYTNSFLRLLDYIWNSKSIVGLYLEMRTLLKDVNQEYNPYALLDLCHGYFKDQLVEMSHYMYYYYPHNFYDHFYDPAEMLSRLEKTGNISNCIGKMVSTAYRKDDITDSMKMFKDFIDKKDAENLMKLLTKYTKK